MSGTTRADKMQQRSISEQILGSRLIRGLWLLLEGFIFLVVFILLEKFLVRLAVSQLDPDNTVARVILTAIDIASGLTVVVMFLLHGISAIMHYVGLITEAGDDDTTTADTPEEE